MIIRQHGGFHYLIRQPEHARQCAQLAAYLDPEFLGDETDQLNILTATRHHDDGWIGWESAPQFHPSGMVRNFTEMDPKPHLNIWSASIFKTLMKFGAWPALLAARHACGYLSGANAERDEWCAGILSTLEEKAFPGLSQEERTIKSERGFRALRLSDTLSLTACTDWKGAKSGKLMASDGSDVEVTMTRKDPWSVLVDPWPFVLPELKNIHVDAVAIPVGEELSTAEFLSNPREYLVRVPVHYLPAGGTA